MRYVNDSKATNVAAALRALAAYADEPVHLILGGSRKGEDFAPLAAALGPNVRSVYLIGETAAELAAAIPQAHDEPATSRRPSLAAHRRRSRATSSCSRRPARASTSSATSRSAARSSGGSCRTCPGEAWRLEARALLILVTLGLVAFGLVMVYSATSAPAALGNGDPRYYLKRQAIYARARARADGRRARGSTSARWRALAPALVVASLVLLLAVLVIGQRGERRAAAGSAFGPLAFQPSELAKLALAIWAAALPRRAASRRRRRCSELWRPIGLVTAVFCVLLLAEPDLGTAIAIVRDARRDAARRRHAGPHARRRARDRRARSACSRSGSSRTAARASSASSTRGTTRRAPASRRCRR